MLITTRQAALLLHVKEGELIFELERTGRFKGHRINMFDNRKGRTRKFSYEDVMAVKRKLHSDKEVKGY
ncbi:TPA: hypothetical protein MIH46_25535 [Klebsiella pneumoniae]|uniref:hypothetical protein n=1 Tax=Serratia sp. Ag1 TaxID=1524467 RepID=UPI000506A7E1|nr:hypothetical protein [Serratia sp. Ag1]EIW8478636.1 hypothetical protein [Klebsiella pneumoniae]KFK92035.1 hypothetical protein JV45_22940 [Serratia sp. Ag2]KFK92133.1 hypothetical protein IV04_25035 [Serratia sp. Ag1]HBX8162426.1 hypothetical protein [Klebsiella pneumoniae]HBX8194766.1 hypothetical protein [Klebsiella pneumoniae]